MPVFDLKALSGLTAKDRSVADTTYLKQIQGVDTVSNTPSTPIQETVNEYPLEALNTSDILSGTRDILAEKQSIYEDLLSKYSEQYGVGSGTITNNDDIRSIADKVSSHYKKFKLNPDKLTLTNDDWKKLHAQYEAIKETYGEDQAKYFLDDQITKNVESNQSWFEQAVYGLTGMGASMAGGVLGLIGNLKGIGDFILGNHEHVEGLNLWDNMLDSALDNNVTRYANDITEYGSLFPEAIEQAKSYGTELNPHGLSNLEIIQTREQQQDLFNAATPWIAMQSGGFTMASMLVGAGEAKIATWLFGQAMKGASWANRVSQTSRLMSNTLGRSVNTADKLNKTLQNIKRVENAVDAFVIPGLVGSMEGALEGLQTKIQTQEKGYRDLDQLYAERANAIIEEKLADPTNTKSREELFQEVWESELGDKYRETRDQIEYASAKAGINNFYINSFINGAINSTLKAGLQADKVQNALRNNRLTGWAFSKPRFNVTGSGANATATATAKPTGWGITWALAKEPIGEATEEYLQTVSNDVAGGAAENNIHEFIENKFNGDGTAVVGDWFGSDWAAAWTAFKGSVVSREAQQAAIMGALSSIMGTPVMPGRRRVINPRTGEIETQSIFNPSNLARGVNERGERESNLEYLQRITPWRSGAYSNYRQYVRDVDKDNEDAEALTTWLRDPSNMDKFDGLVGTVSWGMEMSRWSGTNDEFNYRNSLLGKTVHDAIMLSKLSDSNLGETWMRNLEEISDIDKESEEAKTIVDTMRKNVNIDTDGKTDEEILDMVISNAQKMRLTLASINEESEKIDRLIGDVDDDTRQSLIYSQLMLDDWKERKSQLEKEIADIHINNSRNASSSDYNESEKQLVAKHGSLKAAINYMHELIEQQKQYEDEIKRIEKLGDNATDGERVTLKVAKARLKNINKQLREFEGLREESQDNIVLNEEEIMNLDSATRGRMLRLGAQRLYTSLHENKKEIDRITNEIDKLETQKKTLNKKAVKGAKAKRAKNKKIKEINSQLNSLRKELKANKGETRQIYSDEQQAVIDNLVQQGMSQDADFLDKVVDAGRMQSSINNFYAQRQAILTDPRAYQKYVRDAKRNAQNQRIRMRAEHIGNIQNYTEFADEMDRVLSSASFQEKDIIERTLRDSNNVNYNKYKQKSDYAESLVDQLIADDSINNDLTTDDIEMFLHSLNYLQNKDIDISDLNQVINTLSEKNDKGDLLFRDYVERMNDAHPEASRTVFTSLGSVINTFKHVLKGKQRQDNEDEQINREVPIEETKPENEPTTTPVVEIVEPVVQTEVKPEEKPQETTTEVPIVPTIFDMAYSSADQGHTDDEGNLLGQQDKAYNDEVTKLFETARNIINNSPFHNDIKQGAITQLESINNPDNFEINNLDDFKAAIELLSNTARTTALDSNNNEGIAMVLDTVINALDRMKTEAERPSNTQQDSTQNVREVNKNAATVSTVNITDIRSKYPNSWKTKVYEQYGIDQFLRTFQPSINTEIFFVTDSALTNQCMSEMGDRYRGSMKPILAVVESENGPIEINGKKYQPIGIMPSTGANSIGSNRMSKVRELSSNDLGPQLVMNNNGTPVVTRAKGFKGAVRATHIDAREQRDNNKENNKSVRDLIIQTLPISEQQRLNAMSLNERVKDASYINAKRNFISGLLVQNLEGKPQLYYKPNNLKNDEGNPSIVLDVPISESVGVNHGLTIQEAAQNDVTAYLTEFNSRTSRLYNEVIAGNKGIYEVIPELNSNSSPEEFTNTENKIADILNKKVKNFIYIKDAGYKFYATFDRERALNTGEIVFNITLEDRSPNTNKPVINIGSIANGIDIRAFGKEFIKNLVLDENNNVRDIVKWQINYGNVKILKGEISEGDTGMAFKDLSMLVDDNILTIAANSLQYDPSSVEMESPFNNEGDPRKFPPIVANPESASNPNLGTRPNVGQTAQTRDGATVDVNTGIPIEGTPQPPVNVALENARKLERQIRNNSKKLRLSKDEKYYELLGDNGEVVKRFARVTKVIEADEYGEAFDENSTWITPSTAIGNTVDRIVRDFFGEEFYQYGDNFVEGNTWRSRRSRTEATDNELERIYPNMTREQINSLVDQLFKFKMSLDKLGIKIIPNEVTVSGTINIVDKNNQIHSIPVAGTLDLLGYDGQGNWYIFDMKTVHNYNNRKALQRKPKWQRQLSVYKDLLKQEYGIDVSEDNLKIIPFDVSYPDPNINNVYSREGNSLSITDKNGKTTKFTDAKPRMIKEEYVGQIPLNYVPLNLVWDKLSDDVKSLLQDELPASIEPESIQSGSLEQEIPDFDDSLSIIDDISVSSDIVIPDLEPDLDLSWNGLSQEQRIKLMKGVTVGGVTKKYNKKNWNDLLDSEKKKILDCL